MAEAIILKTSIPLNQLVAEAKEGGTLQEIFCLCHQYEIILLRASAIFLIRGQKYLKMDTVKSRVPEICLCQLSWFKIASATLLTLYLVNQ